jgi:hypothetical protein
MIDINREITILRQIPGIGQYLANALDLLQKGANGLGTHLGADPTQFLPPPPPIQALNVKSNGTGLVHLSISHDAPVQKGINYFVEMDNTPAFLQPQVLHLGTSRTKEPFQLPALDDGGHPQRWYFRAYPQYPGGEPGKPVNFGGDTPTPVDPGGTARLTLLASTGSGTAQSSGQKPGQGFGVSLYRGPESPRQKAIV